MTEDRSYLPSCVVHLTIRYDESLQVAEGAGGNTLASSRRELTEAPETEVETVGGIRKIQASVTGRRPRPKLTASFGDITVQDYTGKRTVRAGDTASRPLTPLTYGSDGFTVIGSRVPLTGQFTMPHPREASQFTITFDYQDLPIDPRLVRALGVEVHLGTVSPDNYARGMAGERDTDGRPLSILKTRLETLDPHTGRQAYDPSTLLFFGTCDEWRVKHSLQGGSIVRLQGRDIRGILIDTKYKASKVAKVDLKQPIDRVVADLIKTMGLDHDLTIEVMTDVSEWPDGKVPSPGDANGLTRVRLGASGDKASSTPANGGSGKAGYWDLITNYCELVGGMPQFRGAALWIRPVKSVYDILLDTKNGTPFEGDQPRIVGDETIRARRMVYGRDLIELEFCRKFQNTVVPTVRCISFDDRGRGTQRFIYGQWPPNASAQAQAKADSNMIVVPQYGIRSVERLAEIARGVYEELGRGETSGTAETGVLASYGGNNADPDLLWLRPMDPVEFVVDSRALQSRAPLVSTLNNIERLTFAEEVEQLYQRLGDRDIARALTALARGAVRELLQFYQVTGIQYDWSTNGCRVQFGFQNYIVPRHHAGTSATSATSPSDVRKTQADVTGQNRAAKIKGEKAGAAVGDLTSAGLSAVRRLSPEQAGKLKRLRRRVDRGKQ